VKLYQLNIGEEFFLAPYELAVQPPGDKVFGLQSPGNGPLIVVGRCDGMYRRVKDQDGESYCFALNSDVLPVPELAASTAST